MSEIGLEMVRPSERVVVFNDEGVDAIEGLEVGEVRQKGIRGEHAGHPDMNSLSILEEAALAQVRQEAEFDAIITPFHVADFISQGENALVISWSQV